MDNLNLVIGISGASGAIYGIRLLETLHQSHVKVNSHLIISNAAKLTITHETNYKLDEVKSLATNVYNNLDIAASISSGSFIHNGMIIAPCSVKTMAEISNGVTTSLLSRAADVTLKERRKLILLVRETPLHLGHLQNMVNLTNMGAIIAPPVNAFYIKPNNIEDLVNHTVVRILDLLGLEHRIGISRWNGL